MAQLVLRSQMQINNNWQQRVFVGLWFCTGGYTVFRPLTAFFFMITV